MSTDVMHRYPVPGRSISEWVVPAREYAAFTMPRGQVLRFVDLEGKQVPDLVCYNALDLEDSLNLANSLNLNRRLRFRRGDVLHSVSCVPLMRIVGYSNEHSLAYGSMCSEELNRLRYGIAATRNCRDNLAAALAPWGIHRRDIPNAFVPFMRMEEDESGGLGILEPTTEPGDHYDLRAETDLIVAVSNCPQERNPCNGFDPTSLGVIIYQPDTARVTA